MSSKDLPFIPLLGSNKSAKLVFIKPTLLPNGKQGPARSHVRREDSGGEDGGRTQRNKHRNGKREVGAKCRLRCISATGASVYILTWIEVSFLFMTF